MLALHKAIKKRTLWRTKLIISSLEIKINVYKIELNKYLENINLIVDSVTTLTTTTIVAVFICYSVVGSFLINQAQ